MSCALLHLVFNDFRKWKLMKHHEKVNDFFNIYWSRPIIFVAKITVVVLPYGSTSGPNYQNLRRFLVSKNLKNKYEWNKNGPWKYEWNINEPWKKSKLTSNMQKRAAFSLERGGGSTETYTRKFENLKTQRCGEGAPWGNEGKRGPFLFRVFQKIIAWYI